MNTTVVGTTVAALRQAKGWTRKALSRRAGVSEAALSRIESGTREPRLEVALALCEALGCTLDDLCGGAG